MRIKHYYCLKNKFGLFRKCMKNLSNSFHLFQDWIRLQPVNIPKEKLKRRNGCLFGTKA